MVAVRDLAVGMYVSRLDREWAGTPFPLQGVAITSVEDIAALGRHAEHVFIDLERGLGAPDEQLQLLDRKAVPAAAAIESQQHSVVYRNSVGLAEELPHALLALENAAQFTASILDGVREGRELSTEEVRRAVEPVVRSILRNHDAYMWVASLRKRDAYDYSHALNCSALAATLGRHLGLPEDVLFDLACGGLLLDVGKLRLDVSLFTHTGPLEAEERAQVRRHVDLGLQVLAEGQPLPPNVQDIVRSHHERHDGSGYPDRLAGNQIPLLGRIAAVVDSFDAMTSDRSHCRARGRHEALQELYRLRDQSYSAEIVEQFMQCLGVYPTGSLVELSNGQVAVVMAQNPARRLRPRVMLLTTPDKRLDAPFRMLDMMSTGAADEAYRDLMIRGTLEPGAHGLDPAELFL